MNRRLKTNLSAIALVAAATFGGGSQAAASTTIGGTFLPSITCLQGFTWYQSTSPDAGYAAPHGGVITSWSYRSAASPPQLKLKVARPAPGLTDHLTVAGESALVVPPPNQLSTFAVRIPVEAGDLIGAYMATMGECGRLDPGHGIHLSGGGDQALGTTREHATQAGAQLGVAARLEADADADGYGDETQDGCPADGSTHDPCAAAGGGGLGGGGGSHAGSIGPPRPADVTAPDTRLTSPPKRIAKGRTRLAFTSSESGSSFECRIDRRPFAACTSPQRPRLAKGRHVFRVRAVDPAGNRDPTPAVRRFTVAR